MTPRPLLYSLSFVVTFAFALAPACGGGDDALPSGGGTIGDAPDGSASGDDGSIATGGDGAGPSSGDAAIAPLSTPPAPLTTGESFYPRAIHLADGTVLASVVQGQPSGRLGGTILESTDDALTFHVVGHVDDPVAQGGLCCATLYELPRALGALAAGTLLWSASVGGDTPGAPMSIPVFASADRGRTWKLLSTAITAGVARSQGGLWEPEFSQLADATLVCHYSDETQSAQHSQKLVRVKTTNGTAWSAPADTVALAPQGYRPGMANVRRQGAAGPYVMSYEVCGTSDSCAAHLRYSTDGWDWGAVTDIGIEPSTVTGTRFRHAPTLAFADTPGANGRFFLVGQMAYGGDGQVSAGENGKVVLVSTESGHVFWYEIAAPSPVDAPFDNFCPNYSSPLLPLDGGKAALEIASRWDGKTCRSYYARGPLLGTGDDAGVTTGKKYRLVSVQSGLCLDVAAGSTAAGGNVQQYTCNGLAPQSWTFARGAAGWTLTSEQSGMCLTAEGTGAAGSNVAQEPCDGGAHQAFAVEDVGLGYYRLALTQPKGVCVDVAGGSTSAGANVAVFTCNDLSPQIWHLEPR